MKWNGGKVVNSRAGFKPPHGYEYLRKYLEDIIIRTRSYQQGEVKRKTVEIPVDKLEYLLNSMAIDANIEFAVSRLREILSNISDNGFILDGKSEVKYE